MKLEIWRTEEDKANGKKPYTAELNEPSWEVKKFAMSVRENESSIEAGDRLLESLWKSGDQDIKDDSELRMAACLKLFAELIPNAVVEMEKKSSATSTG